MESPEAIREILVQATGTEHYWRVFPENDKFLFTDGVKLMAENGMLLSRGKNLELKCKDSFVLLVIVGKLSRYSCRICCPKIGRAHV